MAKEDYQRNKSKWLSIVRRREDNSEIVSYDSPTFPCFAFSGYLTGIEPWVRQSHWHEDVEMISIRQGKMRYNINGKYVELEKGDTLFVNAQNLHFSDSFEGMLCVYYLVVVHPRVLCASSDVESEYILPVLSDRNCEYILFKHDCEEAESIQKYLKAVVSSNKNQLKITKNLFGIWEYIYDAHNKNYAHSTGSKEYQIESLKNMVGYIRENYASKISLDEIAAAGNVSKSGCNNLFKQYAGATPNDFLIRYRLDQATELLRNTNESVTSISSKCGFNSSSYMTSQFVKCFGMTPRQIRKPQE